MKLSKLTGLERGSLETEKTDLKSRISELESILAEENKVLNIIKTETEYIKSHYGRARRTQIDNSTPLLIEREDLIQDDDTTIILTRNNYIKRIDTKLYREQARGGKGIIAIQLKEGDFVKQIISCKMKDYLLILSNTGRAYWLKAYMVHDEGRYGSGKAAVNLVKFAEGEKAETIINTKDLRELLPHIHNIKGKNKEGRGRELLEAQGERHKGDKHAGRRHPCRCLPVGRKVRAFHSDKEREGAKVQ